MGAALSRVGPIPPPEASARAAAAARRARTARAGALPDALRESEAALAVERRCNALLAARCRWLEHEHHRLELALAVARGQALGLDALTASQG